MKPNLVPKVLGVTNRGILPKSPKEIEPSKWLRLQIPTITEI